MKYWANIDFAPQVFGAFARRGHTKQSGRLDLSHWFSTRQVCAQEGSPFKGFPTWRYRVLRTALRLRPRRALSSASGQRNILARGAPERKYLNFELYQLTNHIPVHSRLFSRHPASPILENPVAAICFNDLGDKNHRLFVHFLRIQ